MRKTLSLFIACIMIFTSFSFAISAKTSAEVDTHLQFNENGEFKILQIADIQDNFPMNTITTKLIKAAIETEKPDLIVLTGDNIGRTAGSKKITAYLTITEFMAFFEKYGIPVAAVFGNHDTEGDVSRHTQMEYYEKFDCFIGCAGEDFGNDTCGTYYVPLYSSADANEMIFNLWMIDSGDYRTDNEHDGYAATSKEQIEWYKQTCADLTAQNGKTVPSLMFQHIIVPEVFDAFTEVEEGTEGAVEKGGKYYVLPENATGKLAEVPCPPQYSNGQFDAMVECGDVLGLFVGHDHLNTFTVELEGITIGTTPAVGFASYNGIDNGVRTITLYENDLENFDTQVVTYFDYFDDKASEYLFIINSDTTTDMEKFVARLKYPFAYICEELKSLFSL